MIVDDVCEVICRISVRFQQDLIFEFLVLYGDIAIDTVMECRLAGKRHFLSDNIGNARFQVLFDLLFGKISAVTVVAALDAAFLVQGSEALLTAETVVGVSLFDELLSVRLIKIHTLALDIRSELPADVRTFVMDKACGLQRLIDNIYGTFHIAFLVSILDTKDECTA